ncbi:hypothetical protein T11_18177 [Trichinella zimbabwensis]|uniref:Uncharacterized protein n=1 Tax=Trichinella zimbabwensis TaxID=268475 RepID=A0A0V1HGE3_9BILA|nr:hypothetical protein T11_18177 [Trichinella zimbabwensis]
MCDGWSVRQSFSQLRSQLTQREEKSFDHPISHPSYSLVKRCKWSLNFFHVKFNLIKFLLATSPQYTSFKYAATLVGTVKAVLCGRKQADTYALALRAYFFALLSQAWPFVDRSNALFGRQCNRLRHCFIH